MKNKMQNNKVIKVCKSSKKTETEKNEAGKNLFLFAFKI